MGEFRPSITSFKSFAGFYTKSIQFIKIGPQCVHVWLIFRIKLNYVAKMKDTKIFKFK